MFSKDATLHSVNKVQYTMKLLQVLQQKVTNYTNNKINAI